MDKIGVRLPEIIREFGNLTPLEKRVIFSLDKVDFPLKCSVVPSSSRFYSDDKEMRAHLISENFTSPKRNGTKRAEPPIWPFSYAEGKDRAKIMFEKWQGPYYSLLFHDGQGIPYSTASVFLDELPFTGLYGKHPDKIKDSSFDMEKNSCNPAIEISKFAINRNGVLNNGQKAIVRDKTLDLLFQFVYDLYVLQNSRGNNDKILFKEDDSVMTCTDRMHGRFYCRNFGFKPLKSSHIPQCPQINGNEAILSYLNFQDVKKYNERMNRLLANTPQEKSRMHYKGLIGMV